VAANIDVSCACDLLGKRDHKVDWAAYLELGVGQKIKTAVAYIAGLRGKLLGLRVLQQETNRQSHVETASFAAVCSVRHGTPGGWKLSNRIIREGGTATQNWINLALVLLPASFVKLVFRFMEVSIIEVHFEPGSSTKACLRCECGNILASNPGHYAF
jgi:hypothetical protein